MPQGASLNSNVPAEMFGRVAKMQSKLHRWAAADPGRRFDDLFNLVHDPATLMVAFARVAGNRGAHTAGVDGMTVADVEQRLGVPGFLEDLRRSVKDGTFRPLPVRERMISKPGGSGKLHGQQSDVDTLHESVVDVLRPMGLRLSPAKTRVVHMVDGFDFVGFRIQWKRKRGTNKWYVYTFIADRPFQAVKAKIRALTHRVSQANMGAVITRINQILRGWTNYFRHAVGKHTLNRLRYFVNWRLIRWLRKRHRWRWGQFRRRFTTPNGRWLPIAAEGITLFNPAAVTVTRYRYRGNKIPNPYLQTNHA